MNGARSCGFPLCGSDAVRLGWWTCGVSWPRIRGTYSTPVVFDHPYGCNRGNQLHASRTIQPRRAPSHQLRHPIRVMRRRLSSRGVPLPVIEPSRPGRARGTSLGLARRRSWGSIPSQVCSRGRVVRHLCRSGPTCRSRRSSAPIDFRRGDRIAFVRSKWIEKRRPVGDEIGVDFWASLPSAVRIRDLPLIADRSCLGLCLLQGLQAHGRASNRARPRWDHPPPEPTRRLTAAWCNSYPLMGFWRSFPSAIVTCELPTGHDSETRRCCSANRLPFSVLMRLMPCRSDQVEPDRAGSLSEVLHRP